MMTMKTLLISTVMTLMMMTGCGDNSKPGGPGVNKPSTEKPMVGQTDNTFKLDVPNSTGLNQGEVKTLSITISRGENFDGNVEIKFMNVPQGVVFAPSSPKLMRSEKEVKFTVTAAANATLGDFVVQVQGTPEKGAMSSNDMTLSISKP